MDAGNLSAIISATSGIVGVLLGNSFVAIKEWLLYKRIRTRDTIYLGIVVSSHLDRFIKGCVYVSEDDGWEYGQPAGGQECEPTVKPPRFDPLDIEVEWKVLPLDLMYAVLRLPDQLAEMQQSLSTREPSEAPYYTEYFWERQRAYADFGLKVVAISKRVRAHAGLLDADELPHGDKLEEALQTARTRVDKAIAKQMEYRAESQTPIAPPPPHPLPPIP